VVVKDVAIMLDIHPGLLSRWRKEFREGKIVDDGREKVAGITEEKKEQDRVTLYNKKENTRLREENKLLKKWRRFTDNAHIEPFSHTLKTELIPGNKFNNELDLHLSLKSYINKFYNHKRIHSGIAYNSPAEFEEQCGSLGSVHFIGGTPLAEARR